MHLPLKAIGLAGVVAVIAASQMPSATTAPENGLCRGYVRTTIAGTVTYAQAQQDESLRAAFLGGFFRDNPNSNISEIYYNKGGTLTDRCADESFAIGAVTADALNAAKIMGKRAEIVYACRKDLFGKGIAMPLFVNPSVFKLPERDFLSALNHEYFHADDCKGINYGNGVVLDKDSVKQIGRETYGSILEVRAYAHQLNQSSNRLFIERDLLKGDEFGTLILRGFAVHYRVLEQIVPKTEFESRIIESQLYHSKRTMAEIIKAIRQRD